MKRSPQTRSGFTLIELLCVVAILLVLLALLMPALDAARDQANSAACQSNQRQISVGFHQYCGDQNGFFRCFDAGDRPVALFWYRRCEQTPGKNGYYYWDWSRDIMEIYLAPYIGLQVWRDPAAPPTIPTGYSMGGVLGRIGVTSAGGGPVHLSEIPFPSSTWMLTCRLPYNLSSIYNVGGNGYSRLIFSFEGGAGFPWALHGPWYQPGYRSRSNVLRIDGSVRNYDHSELIPRVWQGLTLYGAAPSGYGSQSARYYLHTGYRPGSASTGWLTE
jgi:prepilin-type N-terminal cleavage/methylation domain-containing protein